jgi:hypothetical protein
MLVALGKFSRNVEGQVMTNPQARIVEMVESKEF